MIKKSQTLLLAVAAFTLFVTNAQRANAWGGAGHRIVAHIAELRLTDHTHQALAALLYSSNQISDNMICNWPDYVRRDMPETGPWHFVDIPHGSTGYDAERDCVDGQCIVHQISVMEKLIADPTKSIEDRNIALRFLVHFAGDLHQPLHCSDYDEDYGGNLRPVIYPGLPKPTSLHGVWDSRLLNDSMSPLGALEYADKLNDRISNRRARFWARGTPEDWANESFHISMESVYSILPEKDGPPLEISKDYIKSSQKVVDLQLMKGGIRLATILNRAMENVPAIEVKPANNTHIEDERPAMAGKKPAKERQASQETESAEIE
ncbi:MAG: S1/P1 nuclease [Kiritimatiellae bacterium]|nr:S1/P1 nuclease [Kiritimatiellia bacterium]